MGATGGSAHGGASPPVNSAGSGCHLGPKAQVSPGRRLRNFVLFLRHFPTFVRSPSQSPHPFQVLRLRFSFHVSILASPRISPPLLPSVSLSFLPLRFLQFYPLRFPLMCARIILFPLRTCISSAPISLSPSFPPVTPIYLPRPLRPQTLQPFPEILSFLGSTASVSRLGFCGPRVAPKRPHTTPPERQRTQGYGWLINISPILPQFTGNKGL